MTGFQLFVVSCMAHDAANDFVMVMPEPIDTERFEADFAYKPNVRDALVWAGKNDGDMETTAYDVILGSAPLDGLRWCEFWYGMDIRVRDAWKLLGGMIQLNDAN